jgi:prohibitin 2
MSVKASMSVAAGFFILLIVSAIWPFSTVGPGSRGIKVRLGVAENKVLEPGFYFINPFTTDVQHIDVTTQRVGIGAKAASEDLQEVAATLELNYRLMPDEVSLIYKEVGLNYRQKIIEPALQESLKAAIAQYAAEDLIKKRQELSGEVKSTLSERLSSSHIEVQEISITSIDFTDEFDRAIEAKVTAEQKALKQKNVLEETKYLAQQAAAAAKGEKEAAIQKAEGKAQSTLLAAKAEAEAIKLKAEALRRNPEIVRLIELDVEKVKAKKWTGKLPQNIYAGAPIPFLNVTK